MWQVIVPMVAKVVGPKVAPILVGFLVFIVLAGISIGIGAANKLPAWATVMLVAVSAGLAGWAYRGMKQRPGGPSQSPSYQSEAPVPMDVPRVSSESAGAMSEPVMPSSIMPPSW